jgi:hypothetical protein
VKDFVAEADRHPVFEHPAIRQVRIGEPVCDLPLHGKIPGTSSRLKETGGLAR